MIAIVITSMGILILANVSHLFQLNKSERYIDYNAIRGIEVVHKGVPYTVNFDQQVSIARFLNESTEYRGSENNSQSLEKNLVDKIVIFRFNGLKEIEITPVSFYNGSLIFSAPLWQNQGLLIDNSAGELQKTLAKTYDR